MEGEYAIKLNDLEDRHRLELSALGGDDTADADSTKDTDESTKIDNAIDVAAIDRQKKIEKIRQQKEIDRQRIIEQERQLIEDAKNIGPTLRDIELQQIEQQLQPHHLRIQPIPADGNCLFRAIAAQCHRATTTTTTIDTMLLSSYQDIRALCAETMRVNESEFAPFCEYNSNNNNNNDSENTITNYQEYVNAVQYSSQHWGGHLELRALSMALQRPVHIYSSHTLHTNGPLIIDASTSSSSTEINDTAESSLLEPIRLSYHLHYFALGEHYNQVVVVGNNEEQSKIEQ